MTYRFHPLAGRRVEVVYSMMRAGQRMFVVETGDGGRMTVPQRWTDRGPAPDHARVAPEALAELRALLDALASRCPSAEEDGS